VKQRIIPICVIVLGIALLNSCLTPDKTGSVFQDRERLIQIRPFYPPRKAFPFSGIFFGLASGSGGPALSLRLSSGSLEALIGEVELTSPFLPAFQFQGTLSAYGPAELLLQVHRVRIFDNWNNGWIEGEAEAFGTFLFTRHYLTWRAAMRDPLGIGEIKSGEVRYFDRYYRNEEGTLRVHVRVEQLKSLIEKLKEDRKASFSTGESGSSGACRTIEGSSSVGASDMIQKSGSSGAPGTIEGSNSIGAPDSPHPLLRALPDQFLDEKEVEESPGLFLSLYNLPLINGRFLEEEIPVFEAE
jgi:hypothetical protein